MAGEQAPDGLATRGTEGTRDERAMDGCSGVTMPAARGGGPGGARRGEGAAAPSSPRVSFGRMRVRGVASASGRIATARATLSTPHAGALDRWLIAPCAGASTPTTPTSRVMAARVKVASACTPGTPKTRSTIARRSGLPSRGFARPSPALVAPQDQSFARQCRDCSRIDPTTGHAPQSESIRSRDVASKKPYAAPASA